MPDLLFAPVPHQDAIDFIRSKPPVSRAAFDGLLPELRARAFCVTGIEDVNVLQRVRDTIAKLPQGARWDDVKKDVAGQISPYLVDADADPEEKDDQIVAANRRAELLLRTHGFQAYQAAAHDVADRQRDTHPYWQYLTMEDDAVRPSHAALDGVILPADSTFWRDHYPPWDWGCRCQVVPISQDDHDDAKKLDAKRPADDAMVLDDARQRELEQNGRLVRGPNQIVNCKSPAAMGKPGAFGWHPGDLRLMPEQLAARYDADIWDTFQAWARATKLDASRNLWEWMHGPAKPPTPPAPAKSVAARPIILPPAAPPRFATAAEGTAYLRDHLGIRAVVDDLQGDYAAELGAPITGAARVAHLQSFADAYHDLATRFPNMPPALHTFVASDCARGLASLDGPEPWMAVKARAWDAVGWRDVHAWEAANGRRWGVERPGTQLADNFRHELGHTLSTPAVLAEWRADVAAHLPPDWFRHHVSEYAATNEYEAVAECVALLSRPGYARGTLPRAVESFVFRKLLGET